MSLSIALASPHMVLPLIVFAISLTASKSPLLAIGNPASITSTFNFSNIFAMRSFSEPVIDAPGLCSPSLNVVSNMTNFSFFIGMLSLLFFA